MIIIPTNCEDEVGVLGFFKGTGYIYDTDLVCQVGSCDCEGLEILTLTGQVSRLENSREELQF